jgi:hypothetical protein
MVLGVLATITFATLWGMMFGCMAYVTVKG